MHHFEFPYKQWKDILTELSNTLREYIDELPYNSPQHVIRKMCMRRNIDGREEKAMLEMCNRVCLSSRVDSRPGTVAALCFWKVCQFSKRYEKRIDLANVCRNHEKLVAS